MCAVVSLSESLCRERGIRTPGPVTVNGFQDRRIRPLCHLSLFFPYSSFGIAKVELLRSFVKLFLRKNLKNKLNNA